MNFLDKKTISILVSVLLIAGVSTYFIQSSMEAKDQASKSAFYEIQKSFDAELATLAEADKAAGSKINIEEKLPKTFKALNELITAQTQSKQVLFQASMKLAGLYLDHPVDGANEKGMQVLKKAVEFAKSDFQKASAYYLLSGVQEQLSQFKEAEDSLKAALNIGNEGMKGELMLSLVRVSIKVKNTAQAKAYSEKLNKEAPGTRAAQEAQKLISKS